MPNEPDNDPARLLRLVRAVCEMRVLSSDTDRALGLVEIAALLDIPFMRWKGVPQQKAESDPVTFDAGARHAIVMSGIVWIHNRTEFRIETELTSLPSRKKTELAIVNISPMPGHLWPE